MKFPVWKQRFIDNLKFAWSLTCVIFAAAIAIVLALLLLGAGFKAWLLTFVLVVVICALVALKSNDTDPLP